jgi:hypothetical protein
MNKFWVGATVACLLSVSAIAQSAGGSAQSTPGQASAGTNVSQSTQTGPATTDTGSSLSNGTTLQAELTKSIDSKKVKSGDEVSARLMQDVKTADGRIVIHKGSKLVGHVTEAQGKTKENAVSRLGVVFDKAVLKGGQDVVFRGVILSMTAPAEPPPSSLGGGNMDRVPANSGRGVGPIAMGGGVSPSATAPNRTVSNPASSDNTASGTPNGTANPAENVQASVITAADHNIKLESGTQLVLQVTGPTATH